MKKGFLRRVFRAIEQADLVLEVVDARFVEQTRNTQIEERAKEQGKPVLVVINKADLVGEKELSKQKKAVPFPSVFVSTKKHAGIKILRECIGRLAKKKKARIAVIGYPNTGKSSVINSLAGRHAAGVSSRAGFTRGEQLVRIRESILLIDSPGVIPFSERDPYKLAILSAKNPENLEDIELGGIKLLAYLQEKFPEKIEKILGKKTGNQSLEGLLEEIALKWNKLKKHGTPDTETVARILLKKWQEGKI